MSKKRIFYAKDFHVKFFNCGETTCFYDCEACIWRVKK